MALVDVEPFSRRVIGCAIGVHRTLGPGLLLNFNEVRLIDGVRRRLLPQNDRWQEPAGSGPYPAAP